jgi:hypothetical protein
MSAVCYVYLSDVHATPTDEAEDPDQFWREEIVASSISQFNSSKWWTRGWTLQELIAPRSLVFFAYVPGGWMEIGDRISLLDLVVGRTGIDEGILRGRDLEECAIATRMSWASDRQTTRVEDIAYCLLGIFNVNMPLLYGEGGKAFIRLQVHIQTTFASFLFRY